MGTTSSTVSKVLLKGVLNTALPGLGSICDFYEAFYDLSEGNLLSASFNAASGMLDILSFGLSSAAKDLAKVSAKKAAIEAVKDSVKVSTNKIAEEALKQIAMGRDPRFTIVSAYIAKNAAKKEIGKQFGKELAKGMLNNATEEAFKRRSNMRTILEEVGMNLIGSGGKDIADNMSEVLFRNFFNDLEQKELGEILKSKPAIAAKLAAEKIANKCNLDMMKNEFALNAIQGAMKWQFDC